MTTRRLFLSFPVPVRLLLVNQFGVNTGFYLLVPFLAGYLADDVGMSAALVGVVLGVRNLSQQGMFLLGGSASDRLGARGVIIAGCALRTVGFGLFALDDSVAVLLTASVLSGLAGALFNPAVRAYLADAVEPERRAEAFALFNVFANAGALVGPLLGAAMLAWHFRAGAVVAATVFAVLTIAQAWVLPARPVTRSGRTVAADWRLCLGDRRFLAFTFALSGLYALQNQLYLVLPMEAERATGHGGATAVLFLVSTGATLAWQVRVTRRASRSGRGRAIACGTALMGTAFLVPLAALPLTSGDPDGSGSAVVRMLPVCAAALLLALGVMVAQPFVMELIPAYARSDLSGTYFGVFYTVSGVIAALGSAAVGQAADFGGGTGGWTPWLVCAALGLGSAAAVLRLDRKGALAHGGIESKGGSAAETDRPDDRPQALPDDHKHGTPHEDAKPARPGDHGQSRP
ncbi:MFS transporter [Yinghuangia sp. YIM S09857]|uniref:MFS transporter n=1 Tax=Yinghuangia sp. YIM S09857 TaxID=3436929 RepID=UPI003F52963B